MLLTGFLNPNIASFGNAIQFALYYGLFSGLVIDVIWLLAYTLNKNKKTFTIKITPVLTAASLILAVVVTYLIH